MSDHLLVSQREDDQYIEKLKAERDALARRVAELEAALKNFTRDGFAMGECFCSDHWKGRDIGGHSPECLQARAALASSGGTGAATRLVDWRKCLDCEREWPFPIETSHMRCPQCYNRLGVAEGRAGLRDIVERAVRAGYGNGIGTADIPGEGSDAWVKAIADRVLAGERATRDERSPGDVMPRRAALGTSSPSEAIGGNVEANASVTSPPVGVVTPPSREQAGRADCKKCGGKGWIPCRWKGNTNIAVEEERCPECRGSGRADSSASERDGRFDLVYADEPTKEQRAAIRREAMLEAKRIAEEEATLTNEGVAAFACRRIAMLCHHRALAGDAPAEKPDA